MSVHTSTAERASSSGEISRKGTADTDDISRKNLEYVDLVSEDCGKHQLSSDIDDVIDNDDDTNADHSAKAIAISTDAWSEVEESSGRCQIETEYHSIDNITSFDISCSKYIEEVFFGLKYNQMDLILNFSNFQDFPANKKKN